jgi:hypothetical protein
VDEGAFTVAREQGQVVAGFEVVVVCAQRVEFV